MSIMLSPSTSYAVSWPLRRLPLLLCASLDGGVRAAASGRERYPDRFQWLRGRRGQRDRLLPPHDGLFAELAVEDDEDDNDERICGRAERQSLHGPRRAPELGRLRQPAWRSR